MWSWTVKLTDEVLLAVAMAAVPKLGSYWFTVVKLCGKFRVSRQIEQERQR